MRLLLIVLSLVLASPAFAEKPNVFVIVTDDLSVRLADHMTGLQQIAQEGVKFTRFLAPSPVCGPSRGTLLTGKLSRNSGILSNGAENAAIWQSDHAGDNLFDWMRAEGYWTCLVGKFINGIPRTDATGLDCYVNQENRGEAQNGTFWIDKTMEKLLPQMPTGPKFVVLAWGAPHGGPLGDLPDQKYFGAFNSFTPTLPPSFSEADVSDKLSRIKNLAMPSWTDAADMITRHRRRMEVMLSVEDATNALIAQLTQTGEINNSYIIFVSDNGYFDCEHRKCKGKAEPYEEALNVPAFVIGPGVVPRVSTELVSMQDIAPTVLDLAGAAPRDVDGHSLVDLFDGPAPWRVRIGFQHYAANLSLAFEGIRTSSNRKVISFPNGMREYYKLETDPYELENRCRFVNGALVDIAGGPCAQALTDWIDDLSTCSGTGCWAVETAN